MIRFAKAGIVGQGEHRAGWPWAMGFLRGLVSDGGLLFDDFVEASFSYNVIAAPRRVPWCGVFHHPPGCGLWGVWGHDPAVIRRHPFWGESLRNLLFGFALSEYLCEYLRDTIGVPVFCLRHPGLIPDICFDFSRWVVDRKLFQVGWYLRNTRLVDQVPDVGVRRYKVAAYRKWQELHDVRCRGFWAWAGGRREFAGVTVLDRLGDVDYDVMLGSSVVCMELFGASANNGIVDCIARGTPVIVNRLPAVMEYLGRDYPLYFECVDDIADFIRDDGRILAAHQYLLGMDRSWLSGEFFRDSFVGAFRLGLAGDGYKGGHILGPSL